MGWRNDKTRRTLKIHKGRLKNPARTMMMVKRWDFYDLV